MLTGAERQARYRAAHREEINRKAMLRERAKRAARQVKARQRRPRCMICDSPIRYGMVGVRYDSKTCGKEACQMKRYRWFVA